MLKFTVYTEGLDAIKDKLHTASTEAELILAEQVEKDTRPYVPAMSLSLANRTRVDDGLEPLRKRSIEESKQMRASGKPVVVYPGPYARYLYYGKVMVDRATGKGPMRIVAKDGTEIIRFRKGAKLTETSRDLKIQRSVNPRAQSHWFEASKAKNLPKWLRVAKEATLHEFK